MRVLYACLDPGVRVGGGHGSSVHVAEMVRAFRNAGNDVGMVASNLVAPLEGVEPSVPISDPPFLRRMTRVLPASAHVRHQRLRRALDRAVRSWRPDFVYERYAPLSGDVHAVTRRHGIPHVLEVNAPLVWEAARFRGGELTPERQESEARCWRSADVVVVPSGPLAEMVRAAGQPSVLTVPNAVDPSVFRPLPSGGEPIRMRLGLGRRFVVGFVGSPKPWHDLPTLAKAMSMLGMEATLLLVGDGPELPGAIAQCEALGVQVVSTGAVTHADVPAHLAAMDACVAGLPADPELWYFSPLKAMEYLAAGRATVVADVGDMSTLVADGVALPYTAGDPASLAASLWRLAHNDALRRRLEAVGPAYAKRHTWEGAAQTVVEAVEGIEVAAAG